MITELCAEAVPMSTEFLDTGAPIDVKLPAEFRSERHDTPQTVDCNTVDVQRYGLFP
jgi:hypothetical protein